MTQRPRIKEEFARAVHDYLLIEQMPLIPADFALVFGNRNIIEPLARRTADLYHTGHFPLIVASGGVKTRSRITEAEALRRVLLKQGIPDSAILTEKQSAHTGENVTMTRALLESNGLAQNISSVISIGHIVAARRFLMTLERHWPGIHKMHVSANPFNVAAQDWHNDAAFRRHAMTEWRKIMPYMKLDHIREVDLEALNRTTVYLKALRHERAAVWPFPPYAVSVSGSGSNPDPVPGSGGGPLPGSGPA